jgi:hypothetical protein
VTVVSNTLACMFIISFLLVSPHCMDIPMVNYTQLSVEAVCVICRCDIGIFGGNKLYLIASFYLPSGNTNRLCIGVSHEDKASSVATWCAECMFNDKLTPWIAPPLIASQRDLNEMSSLEYAQQEGMRAFIRWHTPTEWMDVWKKAASCMEVDCRSATRPC